MSSKRKVLHIVEAMGGGVFTYIVDFANELVSNYDVYIAYAVRKQTPANYREYFDPRIHLIEVKNFGRSIRLAKDIAAYFEVLQLANEIKPDIIHLHSSKAGAIGRVAFDGKKVPLFYTPHGYSFLMRNTSPVKRKVFRSIERICGKRACTTISCSVGEHIESQKITKRAVYVNNGINTDTLQDCIKGINVDGAHPFSVFTLGRISDQKNPELFNRIAMRFPDIRFLWIGDGELRNVLTAGNIEITGWVGRQEALQYALACDVFVLTSLWEGLPISLLEAMYMKKICVVSNVIGNRDVIREKRNGFVCDEESEYVNAIQYIRSKDVSSIAEQAHEDILNMYNTKTMTKQLCRIYETAIKDIGLN
ncbi:MAG: glycosyltransferase family 4 protein [Lachnospiraceae bacterium]|nr:glycosyltransferase family 4 protein [Lachnospiraceae bacterium]